MDEYLFIEFAKLQADRRRLEREQREESRRLGLEESRFEQRSSRAAAPAVVCQFLEQAVMKTFIAVVASVLVNAGALGGLAWSVHEAQVPPLGEVLIVQLPDESALPAIADARPVGPSAARAL